MANLAKGLSIIVRARAHIGQSGFYHPDLNIVGNFHQNLAIVLHFRHPADYSSRRHHAVAAPDPVEPVGHAAGVPAELGGLGDERFVEEEVGAIIAATGYEIMDPSIYEEYGYGRYPDVVTSLEFERMVSASGPTNGELTRPSNGEPPKTIVFLQCIGSRRETNGKPYCSNICCICCTGLAEKFKTSQCCSPSWCCPSRCSNCWKSRLGYTDICWCFQWSYRC